MRATAENAGPVARPGTHSTSRRSGAVICSPCLRGG
jgi:hypothetical protein